jgi:hypothetical protein
MGLLDEAIREHLELKRRRGADPEEVARQERDALGPVRREPEPPAAVAYDADPEPEPEEAPAAPPEPVAEDEPEAPAAPLVEAVPEEPLTPSAPQSGEQKDEWDFDEDDPGPQPEPEPEEDVLEETPEFLQETPEHERLWFEQKPPRDFDFDG